MEKLCIEGKVGSTMYLEIGLKVSVIITISMLILMGVQSGIGSIYPDKITKCLNTWVGDGC